MCTSGELMCDDSGQTGPAKTTTIAASWASSSRQAGSARHFNGGLSFEDRVEEKLGRLFA